MKCTWIPGAVALSGAAWLLAPVGGAQESRPLDTAVAPAKVGTGPFEAPVRLRAADGFVRAEAPGYAAPAWHDVDGDGRKDLVVGQFADGKIRVYKNTGDGAFAAGEWLMAGGKPAEVPGVW